MPTPDRTSLEEIVGAARDLLESRGLTQLTMQAVAERVGVRAPSLYKRVRNRDDLIRLVIEATHRDLGEQLHAIAGSGDPRHDLGELARALRAFAKARPAAYHLVFARPREQGRREQGRREQGRPEQGPPDLDLLTYSSAPLLKVVTDLAGPSEALEGARMVTAWATGFISMELAGAFNLGGDLDRAYEYGITHLTDALAGAREAAP